MPHTITTIFNCTKCQEDLTEVKMAYGLIICPKCGTQHTVQHTCSAEHGKTINTDITISLQSFICTAWGIESGPIGWTAPVIRPTDKDGNYIGT